MNLFQVSASTLLLSATIFSSVVKAEVLPEYDQATPGITYHCDGELSSLVPDGNTIKVDCFKKMEKIDEGDIDPQKPVYVFVSKKLGKYIILYRLFPEDAVATLEKSGLVIRQKKVKK
jgi:hypothetical protein